MGDILTLLYTHTHSLTQHHYSRHAGRRASDGFFFEEKDGAHHRTKLHRDHAAGAVQLPLSTKSRARNLY
jgi:hypothetical protein